MIRILAIESSADETSAAILEGNLKTKKFRLLSNVIHSQINIHKKTGGIVPEVAARNHIVKILPVIDEALDKARAVLTDIDAIAVTAGPGLVTSLMIGVDTARALAFALEIPILPINHMEGHLLSALGGNSLQLTAYLPTGQAGNLPALGLIVSGGHTMLVLVKKIGNYKILGQTLDDAAGECFDKVAKILGLSYPGGPEISQLAKKGNPKAIDFPRPMMNRKDYNFSFSGLKTAVLYFVRDQKLKPITNNLKTNIAASLEQAIVDVLVSKTIQAAREYKVRSILLGGGVSANVKLRKTLQKEIKKKLLTTYYLQPTTDLTTDNAGMIALAGWYQYLAGKVTTFEKVVANPNLELKSWF